jgi:hypothetical protein
MKLTYRSCLMALGETDTPDACAELAEKLWERHLREHSGKNTPNEPNVVCGLCCLLSRICRVRTGARRFPQLERLDARVKSYIASQVYAAVKAAATRSVRA